MSRHLLILDLDETLIHASVRPLNYPPDYTIPPYHIYKRPFLTHFLQTCTRHFEIAIWTSSSADYAQPIISQVWPQDVALAFIWSRERCTYRLDTEQGIYVWIKDLKKLKRKGYALERIVVVDNDPEKLTRQYGNLVCVKSYEGDSEDNELYLLSLYLQELGARQFVLLPSLSRDPKGFKNPLGLLLAHSLAIYLYKLSCAPRSWPRKRTCVV